MFSGGNADTFMKCKLQGAEQNFISGLHCEPWCLKIHKRRSHCQYFRSKWSKTGHKENFLTNSDNQFEQTVLHCWSLFEYLAYRQFAPLFPSAAVFPSSTCSTRVFCRQSHEATWHRCWADNSVHSLYSIAIFWKELMLLMGDGATFPGLSPDVANIDLMWLISCFRFHCEKYLQIKTAPHQPHRSDVIVFFNYPTLALFPPLCHLVVPSSSSAVAWWFSDWRIGPAHCLPPPTSS